MSLSSTELNHLVWRYLQESGYELAAYALDKHSGCSRYDAAKFDRGYLVNLVQKGILYSLTEDELRPEPQRSDVLTLLGSLLKERKDAEANLAEPEPKPQPTPSHPTKVARPVIQYEESLLSKWHPLSEVFAYVKGDMSVAISAIKDDKIIESAALVHPGSDAHITAIAWSPVGNSIITADNAGNLCSWSPDGSLRNVTTVHTSSADPAAISEFLWNANGQYFLSVDLHGRICLFDGSSLHLIQVVTEGTKEFHHGVAWIDDLKFAISSGAKTITISSIAMSKSDSGTPTLTVSPVTTLKGHDGVVTHLLFDKTSRKLASYSPTDNVIKLWSSSSTSEPKVFKDASTGKVHPLILLQWLDTALVSVSIDGAIKIWSQDGVSITSIFDKSLYSYDVPDYTYTGGSFVYAAALSPDKRWLAVGDDSGRVTVWSLEPVRCVSVYDRAITDPAHGICDISWDFHSSKVGVSFKGTESVVLNV